MIAPSFYEAGLQTPVEALDKVDEVGQDLISVAVHTRLLLTAGVKQLWQLWMFLFDLV